MCGFGTQKSPFFGEFFAVFSGTANELMVHAKPHNTHHRPHLMRKEPTDLLNLSRRWTISGFQNVTLYSKIHKYSNPIVLLAIKMVTGPRAIQNTRPLVSISNRSRDINSWIIDFCHWVFSNILVTRTIVHISISIYKGCIKNNGNRSIFPTWLYSQGYNIYVLSIYCPLIYHLLQNVWKAS